MRRFPSSSTFAAPSIAKYYLHEERSTAMLDDFFWNVFDYLRANAIGGDYLEFGSGFLARSFRLAARYKSLLEVDANLFAFDSFQGLPDHSESESHPGWTKGSMAMSRAEFETIMAQQGFRENEYTIIEGLYEHTLKEATPAKYGISAASFIYVDCDLYSSCDEALRFCEGVLQNGTVLAFDDWNCYRGDPKRGEKRAFSEFLARNPRVSTSEFLNWGWHGKSFLIHKT